MDSSFSSADYVASSGDDETYVDVSGDVNVSRDPDANPAFMLKINNAKNQNTDRINATAVVEVVFLRVQTLFIFKFIEEQVNRVG